MLATFALMFCLGLPAQSGEVQDPSNNQPSGKQTTVKIGPRAISVPEGLTMLVRKGNQYGALRFSNTKPGEKKHTGSSDYESVYQGDGSGSFAKNNVKFRVGKVNEKPLVGIGRMSFQTGPATLHVGRFKFNYRFPNWVDMWPAGQTEGDYGFEFSVVRNPNFQSVDPLDPTLQWHRYDSRHSIEIIIP